MHCWWEFSKIARLAVDETCERQGFRVVESYRQTDFPKMYIDMRPVVERMQPEESLADFVG
jgi:hypothetical protein